MLLLNVGCFTLAQKLHGNCPHTYTLGSNVITSVEEEQERDLGIGLLFKAIQYMNHLNTLVSVQLQPSRCKYIFRHDKQDVYV